MAAARFMLKTGLWIGGMACLFVLFIITLLFVYVYVIWPVSDVTYAWRYFNDLTSIEDVLESRQFRRGGWGSHKSTIDYCTYAIVSLEETVSPVPPTQTQKSGRGFGWPVGPERWNDTPISPLFWDTDEHQIYFCWNNFSDETREVLTNALKSEGSYYISGSSATEQTLYFYSAKHRMAARIYHGY